MKNMPGFTADASLYQTNEFYKFSPGSRGLDEPKVIPQVCYVDTKCSGFAKYCRTVCKVGPFFYYIGDWNYCGWCFFGLSF